MIAIQLAVEQANFETLSNIDPKTHASYVATILDFFINPTQLYSTFSPTSCGPDLTCTALLLLKLAYLDSTSHHKSLLHKVQHTSHHIIHWITYKIISDIVWHIASSHISSSGFHHTSQHIIHRRLTHTHTDSHTLYLITQSNYLKSWSKIYLAASA